MDSGIYQISFDNGSYYIGKSENISKRWQTHRKNFQQGTHTKKMQEAYNRYGVPEYSVMLLVHPDHVDIYESILIARHWGPHLLNTTKPKPMDLDLQDLYLELYDDITLGDRSCMLHSTAQHVQTLREHHHKLAACEQEITDLREQGLVLPDEIEQQINSLSTRQQQYHTELQRLSKLGWWDRLWNYKVYVYSA